METQIQEDNYPLKTYYTLWYHGVTDKNWGIDSYKCIGKISSLKDFWTYYNKIDSFIKGIFFLMKEDLKPIWETPGNIDGGYWPFRIPHENVTDTWIKLSISLVIDNIRNKDNIQIENNIPHDINGISISPKPTGAVMKIWNNISEYNDDKYISSSLKDIMNFGESYYRAHQRHKDILKIKNNEKIKESKESKESK